jgi:hypothetical protein
MHKITDSDYTLVENPNHPLHGVKLLTGEYKDVMVVYGTVSIKESPELDIATLGFTYTIQDPANFAMDELESSEEFKDYLGAILQYIITDSLDYAEENNLGVIGIGNNESTTDPHTESSSE